MDHHPSAFPDDETFNLIFRLITFHRKCHTTRTKRSEKFPQRLQKVSYTSNFDFSCCACPFYGFEWRTCLRGIACLEYKFLRLSLFVISVEAVFVFFSWLCWAFLSWKVLRNLPAEKIFWQQLFTEMDERRDKNMKNGWLIGYLLAL